LFTSSPKHSTAAKECPTVLYKGRRPRPQREADDHRRTPGSWGNLLFDYDRKPTTNADEGCLLEIWEPSRLWDQPKDGILNTGKLRDERIFVNMAKTRPYPPSFLDMFWKPSVIRIDNVFLHGYDDETDELPEATPKISKHEATLLYDLLSKILVYNPVDRITTADMLHHPWFSMDSSSL
jgi:serine/threonine protein kinase